MSPAAPRLSAKALLDMAVLKARLAALPPGAPHTLFAAVTGRCDLACAHCRYAGAASAARMPAHLLRRLIAESAAAGVPRFVFFGGEPLLYAGLDRAVARAAAAGLFTELDTNGQTLTTARARALARAGLACAMISLHSPDERRHDAVCGRGSHARALAALRASRAAGLITYVSSCVFAGTSSPAELSRLLAFARRAGAQGARLLPYAPAAGPGLPPPPLAAALKAADPAGFAGTCRAPGRGCAATRGEVLFCDPAGLVRSCPYAGAALGSVSRRPLASFFGGAGGALLPCRTFARIKP